MERVWIYQSNTLLQEEQILKIEEILQEFVSQWTAHGSQLAGSYEIRYDLFIILKVDEEKAMVTGCSIDKSVHLLKRIEQEVGISLFDRMQIAYRKDSSSSIEVAPQDEFRKLLSDGFIHPDTVVVFNNMVASREELDNKWEVPMRESWHAKVFL